MNIRSRRIYYRILFVTLIIFLLYGSSSHQLYRTIRLIITDALSIPAPTSTTPISNLYLLKTHKTGNSTLQNILVRYAWNHELIVGLPRSYILFSSYHGGKKFSSEEVEPVPESYKINMICHHMVFNRAEMSLLLPEDAIYITILRDPATLFRSAFHYFGNEASVFKKASKDGFEAFINNSSRYFKGKGDGRFWWFAKNGMFFDMGYDNMNESESYISQAIRTTEQIFDLVLITEYFDLGLLLLKDKMNWRIEDVAFAAMNARKQTRRKELDVNTTTKIYKWNLADTVLYKHFNDTFWDKVKQYGEDRMKKDLRKLGSIISNYREHCFEEQMIANSKVTDKSLKMFSPPGIDVAQYQLRDLMKSNETCIGLIRPEFQWMKKMGARQKSIKTQTEASRG